MPENVEQVEIAFADIMAAGSGDAIKLDKLLVLCGLAESMSDAVRKIEQGAVRVENIVRRARAYAFDPSNLPAKMPVRVGKRVKIAVIQ